MDTIKAQLPPGLRMRVGTADKESANSMFRPESLQLKPSATNV